MSQMRDIPIRLIISIMLLLAVPASAGPVYAAADAYSDSDETQTSFDYKKYPSQNRYMNALRIRMPGTYKRLSDDIDDDATIPIPGTLSTCASADGDVVTDSYISQGFCSADRYWLITAYDSGKKYPSVIYAVDSESKELVSTLLLPNTYHVGGIAFDGSRIWLTGDTSDRYKDRPFVQYILYDDFLRMIRKSVAEVTEKRISDRVYIKNKPSFLEYDSGRLWVGTYIGTKGTKEGYIYGYPVNEDGSLNTIMYSVITAIDSSAQGMDIDGKYLYISSSYKGDAMGIKSSFITKYEISPSKDGNPCLYVADRESKRVEVPKMNEEILVEDGLIHINFESSATKWKNPVIRTDRILAVRKSGWGASPVGKNRTK